MTVVLIDSYTEASAGVNLTAHTGEQTTWTARTTNAAVLDTTGVYGTSSAANCLYQSSYLCPAVDYEVSATIQVNEVGATLRSSGILCRYNGSGYGVRLLRFSNANSLQFMRVDSGSTFLQPGTRTSGTTNLSIPTLTANAQYKLFLRCIVDSISVALQEVSSGNWLNSSGAFASSSKIYCMTATDGRFSQARSVGVWLNEAGSNDANTWRILDLSVDDLPQSSKHRIICDGNSLTFGATSTTVTGALLATGSGMTGGDYPSQLYTFLGGSNFEIYNKGVSGQTTDQMISDVTTDIDILYSTNAASNIVIMWEATNHLYFEATAQQAIDSYKSYCLGRKAKGFKVGVLSCLPRSNTGTPSDFESKRLQFNTLLRQQWKNFADILIDVGADIRIGLPMTENSSLYGGDFVHMSNSGYAIIAEKVAGAIQTLIRGTSGVSAWGSFGVLPLN